MTFVVETCGQSLPAMCGVIAKQEREMWSFAKCEIPLDDADGALWERSIDGNENESTGADESQSVVADGERTGRSFGCLA